MTRIKSKITGQAVIVDHPDVIIADLADSETHWNAN